PKGAFEKFPASGPTLGTQMKSVGEAMAIGRTFKEAFQKGLRSLEVRSSFRVPDDIDDIELRRRLVVPSAERVYFVMHALAHGYGVEELHELTKIDRWFLDNLQQISERESELSQKQLGQLTPDEWREAKRMGFSDQRLAALLDSTEDDVRGARKAANVSPVFKR